jgi:hypothetical protein
MSVRNLKPVVYATKTSVKDNSEEDTQYFNKNQQDTYKKKDGKPSYVNLRNLAKSVILDDEVILLLYSNIIY